LSAATLSCAVNCLRSFFMESPPHGFYTNPREKTLQIQGRQNNYNIRAISVIRGAMTQDSRFTSQISTYHQEA
jgi:hypothetical protein